MTVRVLCLFLTVPWVGLQSVIVVLADHHSPFGVRCRVTVSGKIPFGLQSFLRDSRNTTDLFSLLAEKVVQCKYHS